MYVHNYSAPSQFKPILHASFTFKYVLKIDQTTVRMPEI